MLLFVFWIWRTQRYSNYSNIRRREFLHIYMSTCDMLTTLRQRHVKERQRHTQPPSSAGVQSRGRSQKFAEQRGGTLIRTIMGWQQFFSHFIFRYKRFQVNRVWLVLKRIECLLWFDLANKSCVSGWCGRGRECWNLLASYGRSHKLNCNTVNSC